MLQIFLLLGKLRGVARAQWPFIQSDWETCKNIKSKKKEDPECGEHTKVSVFSVRGSCGDDPLLRAPIHHARVSIQPTGVSFHADWHFPHLATGSTERIYSLLNIDRC